MNNILLGLFFLILGLLFANMLTNICGCKVVEGQCLLENCKWNKVECPVWTRTTTFLNSQCTSTSSDAIVVNGVHTQPSNINSNFNTWKETECCIDVEESPAAANTPPPPPPLSEPGPAPPGGGDEEAQPEQCIFNPGTRYSLSAEGGNIIAQILD